MFVKSRIKSLNCKRGNRRGREYEEGKIKKLSEGVSELWGKLRHGFS